tara:strand:- start:19682 stop:19966 length:285 start_codon:yes stop_codon:yes gene_type:complete
MLVESIILYSSLGGISSFLFTYLAIRSFFRYNTINGLLDYPNKSTKVHFDKNVNVLYIPSVQYLSENNIKELWYSVDDFNEFKVEYSNTINEVI